MASVATQFTGPFHVVLFCDREQPSAEKWLAVVVAWRKARMPRKPRWRDQLRKVSYQLGVDPLNRRFSIGRDAGLWFGSAGVNGAYETLFHARRRVVRVHGKEYAYPVAGQVLVLLIDEESDANSAPRVLVRALGHSSPTESVHSSSTKSASGHSARSNDCPDLASFWDALVEGDADVRAFMAPIAGDGSG